MPLERTAETVGLVTGFVTSAPVAHEPDEREEQEAYLKQDLEDLFGTDGLLLFGEAFEERARIKDLQIGNI